MIDLNAHHRAVELSHMKRLMKYGAAQFVEDWNLSIALAFLMADESNHGLRSQRPSGMMAGEEMIDSAFKRMTVYMDIHPDARPFQDGYQK